MFNSPGAESVVLPTPLTAADCDLRDFPFMPLDVVRLRDSGLAGIENGEAFRAAVISWCVAWHQIPAASLPDDDAILCRLLGYGRDVAAWRHIREAGGLHGWMRCSDDRLYHPVVAEKANEAWERKSKQRSRGAKGARARWHKHRNAMAQASRANGVSNGTSMPQAMLGDGKGQGQGQGQYTPLRSVVCISANETSELEGEPMADKAKRKRGGLGCWATKPANDFNTFWDRYPRKVAKGKAEMAWTRAIRDTSPDVILAGLGRAKWPADKQYIPHPTTWLNGKRWLDESPPEPAPQDRFVRGAI